MAMEEISRSSCRISYALGGFSSFLIVRRTEMISSITLPGMKQQRLRSTYLRKVMLRREILVSIAVRMSQ